MAAPSHNNSSNAGTSGATSVTWSHTCSGSDRLLIVGVSTATVAVSSVTFNGVALTKLDSGDLASGPIHGEFWYLIAPASTTANIVVTLASSAAAACGASSYTGVHQSQPFGAHSKTTGDSATATNTVTSNSNSIVHDCLALRTGATTITVGSGQTQRWNRTAAGTPPSGTLPTGAGSTEAGGSSVTMSWTVDDATAKKYVSIAASVRGSDSGLKVTIAGTDRTTSILTSGQRRSVKIAMQLGQTWSCTCDVKDNLSTSSAYRPTLGDVLEVSQDGALLFHGRITRLRDRPLGGDSAGTVTEVSAESFADVTDDVVGTNDTWVAGATLKQVATWIVDNYLTGYGISLDGGMATGDTLPALQMTGWTPREMLNHLSALTGWIWRITPSNILEFFSVGSKTSSYSLTAANGLAVGPVTWEHSREQYYNRIVLHYGPSTHLTKTWSITGDGTVTTWQLDYTAAVKADGYSLAGGLINDSAYGGLLPHGADPAATSLWWDYQVSTNSMIRKAGALPNGATASMNYEAVFPQTTVAEGAFPPTFAKTGTFTAPEITDKAAAGSRATALLRKYSVTPKQVTVNTRQASLNLPGTSITLTFADRTISGSHLIIGATALDTLDGQMLWTFLCVEGTENVATHVSALKDIIGRGIVAQRGNAVAGGVIPASDGRTFEDQALDGVTEFRRTTKLGHWTTYTPAWTGSTTNPSGNYTISGWYALVGKTVFFEIYLRIGSSTTFPVGTWFLSLPFNAHSDYAGSGRFPVPHPGKIRDESATTEYVATASFQDATKLFVTEHVTNTRLSGSATAPMTWAQDDRLFIKGSYQLA